MGRTKIKIGLLVNPASVTHDLSPALEKIIKCKNIEIKALYGPQHGIYSHTQDNMITWRGFTHEKLGIPVYSLYGETRVPDEEMLKDIDELVVDLQDVGTRVYTFSSTLFNCMEACSKFGKKLIILDRPNPVNGNSVEGDCLQPQYKSFVGMLEIPMRHGLTMGELAVMYRYERKIDCGLEIYRMKGWKREMWFDDTDLPWVIPSPNMTTFDTAVVYPGTVYLEGTNLSEGRGTTRPFEIIGAPFINPDNFKKELDSYKLPGVYFRSLCFQPSFQKWKDEVCGGIQIHVTDRNKFLPVLTGTALMRAATKLYPEKFEWKKPPYEYEYKKLPIDVIAGNSIFRKQIEETHDIKNIAESWKDDIKGFKKKRKEYLLY
ncbi:MAG: DUF1343 domain-containing protein [Candidatus Schekmanbacteria bacterium]|nr:DUF1343 domain-containing protein [Candidatus Schekmanbacteria bacterium]